MIGKKNIIMGVVSFYTEGLKQKNGIWYSEQKGEVFYPDDGNDICYDLEDNSFWFKHRNNCIVELVKKYSPDQLFFDVGGGNGYVAKAIESVGIETILVEPGEKGCINAKKRQLKNIICSTIEGAGFKNETLPAVGMFDVLEHMKDDAGILKSMHDLLTKDGKLFITVPAHKILWSKEDDDAGHFNRYTTRSLNKKLREAGFEVLFSTYIFSILPVPIFLFRTIPSKLGMSGKTKSPEKTTDEHTKESGLLDKIWSWELNRIRTNRPIPVGGSCLVVARKI